MSGYNPSLFNESKIFDAPDKEGSKMSFDRVDSPYNISHSERARRRLESRLSDGGPGANRSRWLDPLPTQRQRGREAALADLCN